MQSQEGELCGTCMTGTLQHQHGALVCDQCGTMSQLFREERRDEEDDAAPPPGQVRRIYQKKERRARQRRSEAPKQLPMEERIFKYAQLLQVLLQRQAETLQGLLQVGGELSSICQQLWPRAVASSGIFEPALLKQLTKKQPGEQDAEDQEETDPAGRSDYNWDRRIPKVLPHETTLSVCWLAAWLLRAPVMPEDLVSWAVSGQLPYLDMLAHASQAEVEAIHLQLLRPKGVPAARDLMSTAVDLAVRLQLQLPEANAQAFASRFLTDLDLPEALLPVVILLVDAYVRPRGWLQLQPIDAKALAPHPERESHVCIMAALVCAACLVWGCEGGSLTGTARSGTSPSQLAKPGVPDCTAGPAGGASSLAKLQSTPAPAPPEWELWAAGVCQRQQLPFYRSDQAVRLSDAQMGTWMQQCKDTMMRGRTPGEPLQALVEQLEPQAQSFFERARASGAEGGGASASYAAGRSSLPWAALQRDQRVRVYTMHGLPKSEQANAVHPDYMCLLTACASYLGCVPKHLHQQVCVIEQNMLGVERVADQAQLEAQEQDDVSENES